MCRIVITAEQAAVIEPLLRPGFAVLGRVMREPFDGTNSGTSGRLVIELGTVPEKALPKLREAIRKAIALTARPRKTQKHT